VRPGHWLGSMHYVTFSVLTLVVGYTDGKDIQLIKKPYSLFPEVLFSSATDGG